MIFAFFYFPHETYGLTIRITGKASRNKNHQVKTFLINKSLLTKK